MNCDSLPVQSGRFPTWASLWYISPLAFSSRVRLWKTNMKGKEETSLCSASTHMLSHMAGTQRFVESLRMVYIVKPSAFWEIGGRFGFGALQVH